MSVSFGCLVSFQNALRCVFSHFSTVCVFHNCSAVFRTRKLCFFYPSIWFLSLICLLAALPDSTPPPRLLPLLPSSPPFPFFEMVLLRFVFSVSFVRMASTFRYCECLAYFSVVSVQPFVVSAIELDLSQFIRIHQTIRLVNCHRKINKICRTQEVHSNERTNIRSIEAPSPTKKSQLFTMLSYVRISSQWTASVKNKRNEKILTRAGTWFGWKVLLTAASCLS